MVTPAFTLNIGQCPHEPKNGRGDEQLIGRVFGNIHLEYPEITREMVAARLKLRREEEAARHVTERA